MRYFAAAGQRVRLIVQFGFMVITNGYLLGFLEGTIYKGLSKRLCVPGLNCYSCPGALGACPIGALQAVLNTPGAVFSFYVAGFLTMVGAVCGRFVCGWLCPFGLVQDLIHRVPKIGKLRRLPGEPLLRYFKYVVLLLFVIMMPVFLTTEAGIGVPWFCKLICPAGTLQAGVPLIVMNAGLQRALGWLFVWKFAILLVLLFMSLSLYRPFCRYLCPLGAIYGLFHKVALYRYVIDQTKCTRCGTCQAACDLDISVYREPNSKECIRCEKCMGSCPHNAIQLAGTVKKEEN